MRKTVSIGSAAIGGGNPILIQSMTNTDTRNVDATVRQINELEQKGCEIIRVAVPDEQAARAITDIKRQISIPLVADVHFDYRLALLAVEAGCDKLRINPGNIGATWKVGEVCRCALHYGVPIRVGANGGSLSKEFLGKPLSDSLTESALKNAEALESFGFSNIVIAVKASNVLASIDAYRKIAAACDYPLHVGITEAGTTFRGIIKSAVGIGTLLQEGIGDTIRVSLTAPPVEEVNAAKEILCAVNARQFGVEIVSCPTCGRTEIDLIDLAQKVERACENIKKPIKIAVMGCVVNGPGESRDADIGVTGGKGEGLIFRKGVTVKKVPENELLDSLLEEIQKL